MIFRSICVFQVRCREHMKQRGSYWKAGMFRLSRMPELGEMAFGEYEGKCCARDHWELPEDFQENFSMIRWDSDREKVANHLRM